jgi:protein arginine N-methyltransferase 1
VSRVLDEHRQMLSDRARLGALERAVSAVVRPGDVVLDLASGTGILGLMACRAGAARVYSVDSGGIIDVARALARANGCADRMTFVMEDSTSVELPERADVLIGDQIGHFGFEAGLLEYYSDARERLLKPGARIMPERVRLIVGLVESADLRDRIAFWSGRAAEFELSSATDIAVNTGYPLMLSGSNLLSGGECGAIIDLRTATAGVFDVTADLSACRSGTLDAIGGWFVAELASGVTMTNDPAAPDRISRQHVAFPLGAPVMVGAGDRVTVSMRIRPADHLVNWTVDVRNGERRVTHSTWNGMLLPREILARTRPEFVPRLTRRGKARQTVLDLCDGVRPVADIEREVYDRHRDLFASLDLAQTFVAEVVTRYGA